MNEDTEQRICTSQPFCLCVGQPNEASRLWDECCCTGNIRGCRSDRCESCGALLEVINIDTGEPVAT
jgi:hypothetical protein